MNQSSTIYWSHLKMFEECPQKFLWTKGWEDIELGRGPGKGKKRPEERTRHHAVMGIVIQYAIEKMYNDELWRDPKNLSKNLVELVEKEWKRQLADPRNPIDYNIAGPEEDMIDICREGVVGYLQTMKHFRFLGVYAKAEVDLLGWIDKWNPIGGRADTIIRRDDTGITIIDGKNTKHKMRYTDPDQLRWYALLFKLSYRQLPDRLAYVWYRFPYNEEEGETGVEWIDFTEEDLKGIAQRAIDARLAMRKRKFEPTPSPKNCQWCDFEPVCEARQTQRKANAANRKPRASSKVEELKGSGGFIDLSL
jgi:hypothetical protein|tara:strand:+ start:637 stop:1557 length:921 start_codon:yes stop_codon:yes gene_type:complete